MKPATAGFTLTQGSTSTFAHISTPSRSFELVENRQAGWLIPTAALDQHVDYDKSDTANLRRDQVQSNEQLF